MATDAILVLSTFPDLQSARDFLHRLVEERLIACGNILPGVESIYTWKEKVETSAEVLCIMKTQASLYECVQRRLREMHPYDVPECMAIPVVAGLPEYLQWIEKSCGGD